MFEENIILLREGNGSQKCRKALALQVLYMRYAECVNIFVKYDTPIFAQSE